MKRELRLCFSVLVLIVVSSLGGCISDVKPQIKSVLEVAASQQEAFCKGVQDVDSPEWQKCKDLATALYAAQTAVEVEGDKSVLATTAQVLEGLKGTWHVRCDGVTGGAAYGFCSASKVVVNALVEIYGVVNERAE